MTVGKSTAGNRSEWPWKGTLPITEHLGARSLPSEIASRGLMEPGVAVFCCRAMNESRGCWQFRGAKEAEQMELDSLCSKDLASRSEKLPSSVDVLYCPC